jgi:hypothetical protein
MLQYSHYLAQGRCAFADRHRYRFEMSWRRIDGRPDMGPVVSDYESCLLERGMTQHQRITRAEWSGLEGEMEGQITTRLGRYFPESGCLVELVLLRAAAEDRADIDRRVVTSFKASTPDETGRQAWCAFGLDIRLPAELPLVACSVQSACVQMEFSDRARRRFVRCARRGMVREWMTTGTEEWLRQWLGRDVRYEAAAQLSDGGRLHQGVALNGRRRRTLFAGAAPARARAWICPTDGRLYSFETVGLERDETVAARCCNGLTVEI